MERQFDVDDYHQGWSDHLKEKSFDNNKSDDWKEGWKDSQGWFEAFPEYSK